MLELKFAACHRAASPYSHVSPVVADELLTWHLFKHRVNNGSQIKPLPVSMHTNHISSSAMLSNNYDLLRALFTSEEIVSQMKP